jgi:extracellular factor (EF) 3-hydroxypalmitic acid methyl ester biosynthesis protein
MDRSLSKPRGYPGDYFLLSSIYDRQPKSAGLGGYLDRYLLNSTLARAVLARMWSAREFLQQEVARRRGSVSIMNVACGACREYLGGFLEDVDHAIRVACVDNDTEALDYVRDHVAPHLPPSIDVTFTRYNALRMTSAKANVQRFGRHDIIYSVGLCDYIPDDYLVPMLRGWRESLADGGVVYVAFKDTDLYDKTFYQWQLDWYFYQRTFDDCRRLFVEAGYDMDAMEVTRCDMAVIVNFIGRTAAPVRRYDAAEPVRHAGHLDMVPTPMPEALEGSGS